MNWLIALAMLNVPIQSGQPDSGGTPTRVTDFDEWGLKDIARHPTRFEDAVDNLYICYRDEMKRRRVDVDSAKRKIAKLDRDAATLCAGELREYRRLRGSGRAARAFSDIFNDYWSSL